MNTALLLVDIQNDYFPGGAMELVGSFEAGRRALRVLEAFRARGLPVVHVQHVSTRSGATFFLPGTRGVQIHDDLAPRPGEAVIVKHFPNAFRDTGLLDELREAHVGRLVVAGMMTHMCIDSTTRAACDCGFECTLVHDACATRSLSFGGQTIPAASVHAACMAALGGTFATLRPSHEVVATLAASPAHRPPDPQRVPAG